MYLLQSLPSCICISDSRTVLVDISELPVSMAFGDHVVTINQVTTKISHSIIMSVPDYHEKSPGYFFEIASNYHCNLAFGEGACSHVMADTITQLGREGVYVMRETDADAAGLSCLFQAHHCSIIYLSKPITSTFEAVSITNHQCVLQLTRDQVPFTAVMGETIVIDGYRLTIQAKCPTLPSEIMSITIDGKTVYYPESFFEAKTQMRNSMLYRSANKWKIRPSAITSSFIGRTWEHVYNHEPFERQDQNTTSGDSVKGITFVMMSLSSEKRIENIKPTSSLAPPCQKQEVFSIVPLTSFQDYFLQVKLRKPTTCNFEYKTDQATFLASFKLGVSIIPYTRQVTFGSFVWRDKLIRNSEYHVYDPYIYHSNENIRGFDGSGIVGFFKNAWSGVGDFFSFFSTRLERYLMYAVIALIVINFPLVVFTKIGAIALVAAIIYTQVITADAFVITPQAVGTTLHMLDFLSLTPVPIAPLTIPWILYHFIAGGLTMLQGERMIYSFFFRMAALFLPMLPSIVCVLCCHVLSEGDFNSFRNSVMIAIEEIEFKHSIVIITPQQIYQALKDALEGWRRTITLKTPSVFYSQRIPIMEYVIQRIRNIPLKGKYTLNRLRPNIRAMNGVFFFPEEFFFCKDALSTLSEQQIAELYRSKITIAERTPFDFSPFKVLILPETMKHILKDMPRLKL